VGWGERVGWGGVGLCARRAAARGQAAGALRAALCAEAVTRRQPQARAGQVVRADRTAPYASPARQLTRPVRRELRPFAARRGIRKPVRGGLRNHDVPSCAIPGIGPGPVAGQRDLRLMPSRNSASTSARRYRGLPVSLRTSGSCPRRAHDATDAEVTRNRTATCLRVIRSSSMRLPVIATAANPRAAGRHDYSPAELVSASLCSSGSLVDRNRVIRGWRRPPCTVPGKARGRGTEVPLPLALEMVLQVAARNIGQLTDIERPPSPLGYRPRLLSCAGRHIRI
jgi:hypothetical protein